MAQPTSSLIFTETAAGTVTADTFCALQPNEGAASVGGHLLPNPGQPLSFERCNPSGEAAPPFLHQHIDPAPNDPIDLGSYVSDAGQQSAMMASGAWTLCLSDPIHAAKVADQALAISANCVEAHLIKARCSDCLEDALRWCAAIAKLCLHFVASCLLCQSTLSDRYLQVRKCRGSSGEDNIREGSSK